MPSTKSSGPRTSRLSTSPWPWSSSCCHGIPAVSGNGGWAFATPAHSPSAMRPSAVAIVASAAIVFRFTAHPVVELPIVRSPMLPPRSKRPPPLQSPALTCTGGSRVHPTRTRRADRRRRCRFGSPVHFCVTTRTTGSPQSRCGLSQGCGLHSPSSWKDGVDIAYLNTSRPGAISAQSDTPFCQYASCVVQQRI
jgi:hypothetical protein